MPWRGQSSLTDKSTTRVLWTEESTRDEGWGQCPEVWQEERSKELEDWSGNICLKTNIGETCVNIIIVRGFFSFCFFTSVTYGTARYPCSFEIYIEASVFGRSPWHERRRGELMSVERMLSGIKETEGETGCPAAPLDRLETTDDHVKEGKADSGLWNGEDVSWWEKGEANQGLQREDSRATGIGTSHPPKWLLGLEGADVYTLLFALKHIYCIKAVVINKLTAVFRVHNI